MLAILGPLAALAAASGSTAAAAREADVPWSQFQGGPDHHGFLADGPQPPYRVRWSLPAPAGDALSGAIVVGEHVVTVGEGAVYGVDLSTGRVDWQIARAGGPIVAPAVGSVGDREVLVYVEGPSPAAGSASASPSASRTASPPSPTGETGAAPAAADSVSSVVAVALQDRQELWRVPLQATSRSSVTIEGDAAFVGDQEGHVYALSLEDGSSLWVEPASAPGQVDAPVAVADGNVYAIARNLDALRVAIAAFDVSTGERAWPPLALPASSTAGSAPLAGDGSVILGSADRRVHSLSAADGSERWSALVLSFFSPATSPALASGSVFAADVAGGLYRLDAADGNRRWSHQLNDVVLRGSPVVSGATALLGLGDGRLVAIDVGSGHLVWEGEPSRGPIGAIALSGDAVIAVKGGEKAGLIAFEHDPGGALVDIVPPTRLDPGVTLSRYLLAAIVVFAISFLPGRLARRRFGQPGPVGEEAGEAEGGGLEGGAGQGGPLAGEINR